MNHNDYGHSPHHDWHGPKARRGDMGPLVLGVLTDKPMHGYEIISTLEEKSHGLWRPSPGSIYPTLQHLEELDYIKSDDAEGKKIYSITEQGRTEAAKREVRAPWHGHEHKMAQFLPLRGLIKEIMGLTRQIMHSTSDEQLTRATKILESTRDQLAALAATTGESE